MTVAVLQGAVPQDQKWQADNVEPTRDLYTDLNQEALGAQLIVWPESALPQLVNEVPQYLGQLYSQAARAAPTSSWGSSAPTMATTTTTPS